MTLSVRCGAGSKAMNMTRDIFRKPMLAALAGALFSVGVVAQAADKPRHDPVERLSQALELSVEQTQDIRALMQRHRQAQDASRQALHEEIRQRLSPEQQERLDAMRADRKGQYRRGGPRRHGMAGSLRGLDLSDEQHAAIRTVMSEHRARMQAERAARGTDRQRSEADRAAWREARQSLHSEIREILTPEQVEQLDAQRRSRGEWRGERGRRSNG